MDIDKNEKYQVYKNNLVIDVPIEHLKKLVTLFIDVAALNLGAKATKADVDQIVEFISGPRFNIFPIMVIASAFTRGSLGKLRNDKMTLNPRNIYEWLSEVTIEYRQWKENKDREDLLNNSRSHFTDLLKYPLGQAICKKIDWYRGGLIDGDEWDKIPLKELAEMIGKGHYPSPSEFGIKE